MNKRRKLHHLITSEKIPEYVLFHPILMHFAARFHGTTYSAFASDYHTLVESNITCLEYFDFDAVSVISDPYRETSAFGAKVTFPIDSVPLRTDKIVQTSDDIESLKNPDVYKAERTLDRIKGVEYYRERLGDDIPVIGWIEGPLAESCDLAGDSDILLKIALEPDFVRELMDKCLKTAKDFAQAQIEAGADVMGVGDAICSQISADMYEGYVLPLHMELFDYIHSLGALVKLHICGNITHLLPKLKKTGADIVDIDWMVSFEDAHRDLGKNVVVCGNLDPVSVIQNKPVFDIIEASKNLITAEHNKKFIFSGGCEITVNTPVENLKAMKKVAF
ncbi:MAG: uroporphyrinogen decarboxylase family protein [Candidatus Latescibacteria bacterium]|nr:uroporphyrinogen decarboxylase family protein [Candidatus Latescibacterota bacterium]